MTSSQIIKIIPLSKGEIEMSASVQSFKLFSLSLRFYLLVSKNRISSLFEEHLPELVSERASDCAEEVVKSNSSFMFSRVLLYQLSV
jgi:predicted PurR-regulated permease PerM